MIRGAFKTLMQIWSPHSSSKKSSSWWVMDRGMVKTYMYSYSGAFIKHHAALKLILRGQDLALGHINWGSIL